MFRICRILTEFLSHLESRALHGVRPEGVCPVLNVLLAYVNTGGPQLHGMWPPRLRRLGTPLTGSVRSGGSAC